MRRFVLIMLGWLGAIYVIASLMHHGVESGKSGLTTDDKQQYARQVALLRAVASKYQQQQYLAALQTLEASQALFTERRLPGQLKLGYYLLKGKVHWALWEYVEAERAWQKAQAYAGTPRQKQMLTRLTQDSLRVVNDINRERNQRNVYLASPHVGPAAELKGKIVLIYIFLVDNGGNSWSLRDRGYVQNSWRTAQAWLQAKAREYGSHVRFTQRLFLVDKNPLIKRLRVGDLNSKFKNSKRMAMLVAQQLGYPDMLAFTGHIKAQEQADQAMVLFHLDRDGRSYATRCMLRCSNQGEYAVLLESTHSKKWQSLQYAQAHESLHLFGADDLYNIRNAKYYGVRDIMNYPSSQLQVSTLETLTAWSVGLTVTKPHTPFKIKTLN